MKYLIIIALFTVYSNSFVHPLKKYEHKKLNEVDFTIKRSKVDLIILDLEILIMKIPTSLKYSIIGS